jgi:hypothetical protein
MSTQYVRFPSAGGSSGNAAAGQTGLTVPAFADYIGYSVGGVLTGVSASTPLPVTFTSGGPVTVIQPTASLLNADIGNFPAIQAVSQSGTWNVGLNAGSNAIGSVSVSNFPSTQPVSGTVTAVQGTSPWVVSGTVTANAGTGTFAISAASLPLPTGASTDAELGVINTTLGSPFQAGGSIGNTSFIATQSSGSNLHVDVDNFPATQPVSAVSLPLPTGASTSADQVNVQSAPGTPQTTAITIQGNASGVPVPISGTITAAPAVNTNGSASNSTAISNTAVVTFSPPSHAVGFVIEAESSNTVNLRYAAGTTATNSTGMLLEPGRDSGYIPTAATVTIIAATTATGQSCGIQWILSS